MFTFFSEDYLLLVENFILSTSSLVASAAITLWIPLWLLSLSFKIAIYYQNKKSKIFPINAQKLGFADALAKNSVVIYEYKYTKYHSFKHLYVDWINSWGTVIAWALLGQFFIIYGARGISLQLDISFFLALLISMFGGGFIGIFRKKHIQEQLQRQKSIEGKLLDWDDEAFLFGMRLRIRFHNLPHKSALLRHDQTALIKDHSDLLYAHGIGTQPYLVHHHGAGLLVSEFRTLKKVPEINKDNWLEEITLKDLLYLILTTYIVGKNYKQPVVSLLDFPNATIMVSPLTEHVDFLKSVAERLRNRKNIKAIHIRDVVLAAHQEFPSRFNEQKLAEILAKVQWSKKNQQNI